MRAIAVTVANPAWTCVPVPAPYARELDALTAGFVADFCRLMSDAHFAPLDQAEWDVAQAEQFLFTLPCKIKWTKLDRTLVTSVLDRNPDLRRAIPWQFNDSLVVFHRGGGVATATGRFIPDKADMLVQMWVVEPWAQVGHAPTPLPPALNPQP